MKRLKSSAPLAALLVLLAASAVAAPLAGPGQAGRAHAANPPLFAIDADTTNGVCSTLDASRTVSAGTSLTVAVCLMGGSGVTGANTISLNLPYSAELTATDVASDLTTDLNSNPNFNEAGFGNTWDCNQLNNAASAPNATPSPATLNCVTADSTDGAVSPTVLVATLSLTASFGGTATIDVAGASNLLTGTDEDDCIGGLVLFDCTGATINITGGGAAPTATDTPTPTDTPTVGPTDTPTPSPTVCSVGNATCTPAAQERRTITPTPTLPATSTNTPPAAGETPVSGQSPQPGATQPPGGGAGAGGTGTIRLPDTGVGSSHQDGTIPASVIVLVVIGIAGVFGFGGAWHLRARSRAGAAARHD